MVKLHIFPNFKKYNFKTNRFITTFCKVHRKYSNRPEVASDRGKYLLKN
jgi:hypothetical protein